MYMYCTVQPVESSQRSCFCACMCTKDCAVGDDKRRQHRGKSLNNGQINLYAMMASFLYNLEPVWVGTCGVKGVVQAGAVCLSQVNLPKSAARLFVFQTSPR